MQVYFTEYTSLIGKIVLGKLKDDLIWLSFGDTLPQFQQYIDSFIIDFTTKLINKDFELFKSKNPPISRMLMARHTSVAKDASKFVDIIEKLDLYFQGENVDFTSVSCLFPELTDFQSKILQVVRAIPYGQLKTYKDIAEDIGSPNSFRAVGNAVNKNPIPIIVPCHRVVKSDGSLGGYSYGVSTKRKLLSVENISI